jgi:hypothetical protein
MPVARYFLFVGGVLLALLFIADAYAPTVPMVNATETGNVAAGVNKSVIRIRSDRKWPERVVFDTNLPTIVPAQAAETTGSVSAPPTNVAEISAKTRTLDSYAQLKPPETRKLEPKPQHKRKIAKTRIAPPVMMVAQQPRFGFFNTW